MSSMKSNEVRDLVKLSSGAKSIGCKLLFKTKKDFLGTIERYKAWHFAIEFSKEGN